MERDLDQWLQRVENLLDYQKQLQLEEVTTRLNRGDLISLRILLNSLKDFQEMMEEAD